MMTLLGCLGLCPSIGVRRKPPRKLAFLVIQVLLTTPAELAPARISVTDERGVLIEWCNRSRELNVEVLPNAMLDVSTWESGELIEQAALKTEALWRLSRCFAWLSFAE
jgi:hypothetical protein